MNYIFDLERLLDNWYDQIELDCQYIKECISSGNWSNTIRPKNVILGNPRKSYFMSIRKYTYTE